ncbi:MAG: hypothetical protein EBU23_13920, partial [Mycobacteriaceae bacterium]|nr:hypothetical protein [Mycobacteriaceae bacterium]
MAPETTSVPPFGELGRFGPEGLRSTGGRFTFTRGPGRMPLGLSAGGVTVDVALSASGLAAVVGSEV